MMPIRNATFTTADSDEVMLEYIEYAADRTGTKQVVFYSWQAYKAKRAKHGPISYPMPALFQQIPAPAK